MVSWVIILIEFGHNFSNYGVVTQSGKQLECVKRLLQSNREEWRLG